MEMRDNDEQLLLIREIKQSSPGFRGGRRLSLKKGLNATSRRRTHNNYGKMKKSCENKVQAMCANALCLSFVILVPYVSDCTALLRNVTISPGTITGIDRFLGAGGLKNSLNGEAPLRGSNPCTFNQIPF